jgi:geranylgeranyl pyrophosphate synthase
MNCNDPDVVEARYLQVIRYKTARLFEASARLGAILNDADAETEEAAAEYGRRVGTAFQLIDDALDYAGVTEDIGKNVGDDLREGKPTLPRFRWNEALNVSSTWPFGGAPQCGQASEPKSRQTPTSRRALRSIRSSNRM